MKETDEEIKVSDVTNCYVCGAKQVRDGYSLHCWDIEYACGCKIWGALGVDSIWLSKKCPNGNMQNL